MQAEHTDPTDRASSSSLAGAQAGRTPKGMPTDTPPHCSGDVTHTGRKPVGTTGLPPRASSAPDIRHQKPSPEEEGDSSLPGPGSHFAHPPAEGNRQAHSQDISGPQHSTGQGASEAASRQMPEDRAVRLPRPPGRPITTEVTHCSHQPPAPRDTTTLPTKTLRYQRRYHTRGATTAAPNSQYQRRYRTRRATIAAPNSQPPLSSAFINYIQVHSICY